MRAPTRPGEDRLGARRGPSVTDLPRGPDPRRPGRRGSPTRPPPGSVVRAFTTPPRAPPAPARFGTGKAPRGALSAAARTPAAPGPGCRLGVSPTPPDAVSNATRRIPGPGPGGGKGPDCRGGYGPTPGRPRTRPAAGTGGDSSSARGPRDGRVLPSGGARGPGGVPRTSSTPPATGAPASGPGVGEVGGAGGGVLRRGGCCGDWGVETRAVWACPCRPRSPGRWSFSLGGRAGVGAGVRGGGSRVGTWLRPGLNGGCFHPLAASPPGGGRAAAGPLARGWQGSGGAHEGGLESIDLMRNAGGEVAPFGHA